ncbi:MAG: hypothetical protein ACTSUG_17580 [Candidatus Helarchaeota archaeon]
MDDEKWEKVIKLIQLCKQTGNLSLIQSLIFKYLNELLHEINVKMVFIFHEPPIALKNSSIHEKMEKLNQYFFNNTGLILFKPQWINTIRSRELIFLNPLDGENHVNFSNFMGENTFSTITLNDLENLFKCYFEIKSHVKGLLSNNSNLNNSTKLKNNIILQGNGIFTPEQLILQDVLSHQEKQLSQEILQNGYSIEELAKLKQIKEMKQKVADFSSENRLHVKGDLKTDPFYLRFLLYSYNYYFLGMALLFFILFGILNISNMWMPNFYSNEFFSTLLMLFLLPAFLSLVFYFLFYFLFKSWRV